MKQSRLGAVVALGVILTQGGVDTRAADILWTGSTGSYNNAGSWAGGVIPGIGDSAINNNGTNNVVQINNGDPDWAVGQILAGKGTSAGAFEQNGQTLTLSTGLGLGLDSGGLGVFTLNGGSLNYGSGGLTVGQLGRGIYNIKGGSISGSSTFAVNLGTSQAAVNATLDAGTNKQGHTWFERGFYASDATRGLPAAGSTIVNESLADHSYTMAPSYAANNSVMVGGGISNATITLTAPVAATALSFLGSSGNGAATINYTVHFNGAPDETGSFVMPDWYPPDTATVALRVGGRVRATGLDFQNIDGAVENPKMVSVDVALANTTSSITSIDLTYVSGGVAGLMAVSRSSGADFTPLAITGYNADIVLEAGAPIYVANNVTNVLNQTAGAINITGEFWVGNYGSGIYNFSGGTNNFQNWFAIGRSGGHGEMTMTGGELSKTGNGNFMVGSGYQATNGATPTGLFNHSGGTINCTGEFMIPENAPASGTYNISGSAALTVNNWMQVGRSGGAGLMNMSGGTVTKTGGGNFIVGDNATGVFNHSGGTLNISGGEAWVGQGGSGNGTYNLSSPGQMQVNNWFAIGREGGNGTLNMSSGTITKTGGGVFIIGDNSMGYMAQDNGTVSANELWVGQAGNGNGTYDLRNGSVTVSGYVVIGRDGQGALNMSGGTFTKTGDAGSHLIIASGGVGNLTQTGGDVISTNSETWIAENGNATWTMIGGSATLSGLRLARWTPGFGTLNLNGGTMTVTELLGGDGSATVFFAGGKLVAGANNPNFMHDLDYVSLSADTIIDTAGFSVGINQVLDGSATLIKAGAGTLSLNGSNTHSGPINVNAGKLASSTAVAGANAYAVAANASFGVSVASDNGQLLASSVALAGGNTLDVDLSTFGSPAAAPLAISGALTVNGTVPVNIQASGPLQLGVYPLITSSSRAGTGTFVIGSLPLNTVATIVDNGTVVSLDVTSVNAPRWEGLAGGDWDIGITTNWINGGTGLPTFFSQGSAVIFNDEAQGVTTVNLVATVLPTSVTVINTNLPYTISGSGKISGTTGLSKQGTGTLTIANVNDYTGATVISGGVLSAGNLANAGQPSAIGAGPLNLAGGTLSYNGPAAAINRGYNVSANSALDLQSQLTLSGVAVAAPNSGLVKSGPAQLTYTTVGSNYLAATGSPGYLVEDGSVVFDGSAGGQTNIVHGGRLGIGEVGGLASVMMTNTTVIASDVYVGHASNTVGSLTVENGANLTSTSWLILGDRADSVNTMTINGGTVNVPNGRLFLCSAPGTHSTLNINGGTLNKSTGDTFCIADGGWNGAGARTGIVNQVAGTVTIGPEVQIGQWAESTGIWNLHGGEVTSTGWFVVGRDGGNGTFNIDGGTFTHTSSGQPAFIVGSGAGNDSRTSVGLLNHSGGTINCTSEYWVGENTLSIGTNNISGTAVVNIGNWMSIGRRGLGVVNFLGGTITKTGGGNFIIGDNGTAIFTQSGGTLSVNSEFWIGQSGSGNGTFNMSAGTTTVGSWAAVGRAGATGVWNMSGGSFTKTGDAGNHLVVGSGGPATINQTGGTITSTLSDTWVGENSDATWNLDGGEAVLSVLHIAQNSGRVAAFNLNNNGRLTATEVTTGNASSSSTLNWNGGTLAAANGANGNFLHGLTAVNVLGLGAKVDTGTNVINFNQPLLDGTGGGGLTKLGTGTLYLNGVNTYTGPTLVSAGALGGSGTIAGSVTVSPAGAIAPIGTLTVNNDVTLGGETLMEVSAGGVSDRLAVSGNIAFGGILKVVAAGQLAMNDTLNLFDWGTINGTFSQVLLPAGYTFDTTKLYVDGTIRVTSVPPPGGDPVRVINGVLVLTGTGGTPGGSYAWLTSPNVAAPMATWTTNTVGTFDANGSYSNGIPVDPSTPARFFRLKTP